MPWSCWIFGKLTPMTFLEWLMSMEDYFDWYAMPGNIMFCFVKAKLKGTVCLWWHSIEDKLNRTNQLPINTWNEMKFKMEERFLPIDYKKLLYTKMFNLKRYNKLVQRIHKRISWVEYLKSSKGKLGSNCCAYYKAGLQIEIQLEMVVV